MPCFKVGGKGVAGFGASQNHCTYFPMSGSITTELPEELLIEARRREIERSKRA